MNPWSSDDIANADLTFDPGTFSLPQTKIPETPTWFKMGLAVLRKKYPNDRFEGRMVSFDAVTNKPCATPKPDQPSEGKKYIYYPRIRCHDCPKKMYLSWSERDGDNFEIHLKNKHHVERVLARIQRSKQEHGEESQSLWPEDLNRARRREEALHDPKEARKVPQIANDLTGVNLKKPIEPVPNDWVASRPMTPGMSDSAFVKMTREFHNYSPNTRLPPFEHSLADSVCSFIASRPYTEYQKTAMQGAIKHLPDWPITATANDAASFMLQLKAIRSTDSAARIYR
ncbi:hypothetical protein ACEPPN_002772 [Leptodophora sp. 'Broadleaf-Isolate-01']